MLSNALSKEAMARATAKRSSVDRERDREIFNILRLIRGETAAKVARKANLSHTTIQRLRWRLEDGGTRFPKFNTLRKIAHAYGYRYALQTSDGEDFALHPEAETPPRALAINRKRRGR